MALVQPSFVPCRDLLLPPHCPYLARTDCVKCSSCAQVELLRHDVGDADTAISGVIAQNE